MGRAPVSVKVARAVGVTLKLVMAATVGTGEVVASKRSVTMLEGALTTKAVNASVSPTTENVTAARVARRNDSS